MTSKEAACVQLTLKEATGLPAVPALKAPSFSEYRLRSQSIGSAAVTLHLSEATTEILLFIALTSTQSRT